VGPPVTLSPDVRCGLPGLRLLGAGCAPPSMAPLAAYAVSRVTDGPSDGSVREEALRS